MKKMIVLLMLILLTGCAGNMNKPIARETLPLLQGKSLALVTHESPSFVAMTSGKGMFAVAGVGAAVAAGNQLVKDSQIEDPGPQIGQMLAKDLGDLFGLQVAPQPAAMAESTGMREILKLAADSDYALDVETRGWSFIYDGFKFSDYHVGCNVRIQFIDVAAASTISEGVCLYSTKTAGKPAVSYETLLENDAAYIKQALADGAAACVEQFKTELF